MPYTRKPMIEMLQGTIEKLQNFLDDLPGKVDQTAIEEAIDDIETVIRELEDD